MKNEKFLNKTLSTPSLLTSVDVTVQLLLLLTSHHRHRGAVWSFGSISKEFLSVSLHRAVVYPLKTQRPKEVEWCTGTFDHPPATKNVVAGFLKLMLRHRCVLHKIIVQCEICVYSEEIKRELKRILI